MPHAVKVGNQSPLSPRRAADSDGDPPLRHLACKYAIADVLVYDLAELPATMRMQMAMLTSNSQMTLRMTRWRMLFRRPRPTSLSTKERMSTRKVMARAMVTERMRYYQAKENLMLCASVPK